MVENGRYQGDSWRAALQCGAVELGRRFGRKILGLADSCASEPINGQRMEIPFFPIRLQFQFRGWSWRNIDFQVGEPAAKIVRRIGNRGLQPFLDHYSRASGGERNRENLSESSGGFSIPAHGDFMNLRKVSVSGLLSI